MESFFKETITGIIILGAIGSILAAATLWSLNKAAKFVAPKIYSSIRKFIVSVAVFYIRPGLKNQAELYIYDNQNKLNAYYSSQKTKVTITLTISSWIFIWVLIRLKIDSLETFSFEAVSCISFIFILLGVAVRSHLSLMVPLFIDVDEKVEEALNEMDPETLAAYQQYKANKALQRKNR